MRLSPAIRLEQPAPLVHRVDHVLAVLDGRPLEVSIDEHADLLPERVPDQHTDSFAAVLLESPQVAKVFRLTGLVVAPGPHGHHIALIREAGQSVAENCNGLGSYSLVSLGGKITSTLSCALPSNKLRALVLVFFAEKNSSCAFHRIQILVTSEFAR